MPKLRILLDMDEVLSDFCGAAARLHGYNTDPREPGVWSMELAIGITEDEFWRPINSLGQQFWERLPVLPHAHETLDLVKSYTDDWYIATAPSRDTGSIIGKCNWLRKYFDIDPSDRLVPTRHKHLMANKHTVLIDDRESNVVKFIKEGGMGITYPSLGNSHHDERHNPLDRVSRRLRLYKQYIEGKSDAPTVS